MLTAATKPPPRPAPQSPENISTSGLMGEKCREQTNNEEIAPEKIELEKIELSLKKLAFVVDTYSWRIPGKWAVARAEMALKVPGEGVIVNITQLNKLKDLKALHRK
ncbi:hypothetical protein AgCh_026658 [Apium graveolens]